MNFRSWALLAAGLSVLGATAASGAEWTAQTPAARWNGLYGGGQVGFGMASAGGSFSGTLFGVSASGPVASYGMSGFAGGGQLGFNRQVDAAVLGVEVGVTGADINGSGQQFGGGTTITATSRIDMLATLRARAGVALDRLLVYAAGGVATGHGQVTIAATGGVTGTARASQGLLGWSAGLGAEYAVADRWSLGVDYQHIDFGSSLYSDPANAPSGSATVHLTADVVAGRVNYRF